MQNVKRRKMVENSTGGPRTRGRANKLAAESKKQSATPASIPVEVPPVEPIHKDAPLLTAKEKLQNLRNGPGSMASYNELREREKQLLEKQQLEKEIPEGESATQQVISQSGKLYLLIQLNHFHLVSCIL